MNATENWINETLESLDNVQAVAVPLSLKYALEHRSKPREIRLSASQKWAIVASIVILLAVNLVSMTQYSRKTEKLSSIDAKKVLYKEYFSSDY